jgi:predicted MPP superfamily phosphohydrolase
MARVQAHELRRGNAVNRRKFLKRVAVAGLGVAGLGAADAFLIEPRWIAVTHVPIPVEGLGPSFDGFRVVLVSDTHCGPYTTPAFVGRVVRLANRQQPDVVLLLGDYCHRHRSHIAPGIQPFAALRARHGAFAVLGNHDHWEDAEATRRTLACAGATELTNRAVVIRSGAEELAIGGVGDLWEDTQDPAAAFRDIAQATPRLLMSHNPDYAEALPEGVRVDLMVCGHTHGGQVVVPFRGAPILPSRYGQKYRAGLVRGPRCRVYVTRGLGVIRPPVRFCCRPELTVLTLRCAAESG